ncbi:MAG: hypothetical protein ACRCWI_00410 [Brevinema sp.]
MNQKITHHSSIIHLNTGLPNTKYSMGIKDTLNIHQPWIQILEQKFAIQTIDKSAYKGRAIDFELINPLTLRLMTGSSSGTAINVLMGINDLGVGTDGGGSVIYPALSVNIYSVMLAGVGFQLEITKTSTDNILFSPSLGLMAFHKDVLNSALELLVPKSPPPRDIAIGGDRESLQIFGIKGKIITLPDSDYREELILYVISLFQTLDILLIKEQRIDVDAYGDSVLGTTSLFFAKQQKDSNKKIGKILNMIEASVFTIPDTEAASGYLIIAKKGISYFQKAWELFYQSKELRTQLFLDYFGNHTKENL